MAGGEQLQSPEQSAETMPEPTTPAQRQAESHEEQPKHEEEEDEERVVTLSEVLQEESMMAETADAVLGDASDTSCSYALGHIRQALYACLTCTPAGQDESKRAGVCLACSYNCHADHELIELYTKREFRCDCGNDKFPKENPCKLTEDKAPTNARNVYSQNFTGVYCSCHRPYPDPERTAAEIMVQCVICEDWLHEEHIFPASESGEAANSVPEGFDEFICVDCMKKHPFLMAYSVEEEAEEGEGATGADGDATEEKKATAGVEASSSAECILEQKQSLLQAKSEAEQTVRPTFWPWEWREALCQCSKCVVRFEKDKVAFLMDTEDSLQAYEAKARAQNTAASSSVEDAAERAFQNKLSHQQQVEMAIGYNHMKSSLQNYLATFAAGGKTVRAEDIQSFFQELQRSKRQKTEA